MNRLLPSFPILCAAALLAGCAKAPADEAPDVEADLAKPEVEFDDSVIFSLFEKVDGLLQSGDTNEATRVFLAAVDEPDFAPVRPQLFATLLRYLLFTGQIDEAKSRYLAELRVAPDNARPVQDYIYGFLLDTGDAAGALDWARALVAQDIPDDFRALATDWLATGLLSAGDRDGALAAVTNAVGSFAPDLAAPIAQRFGQAAIGRKDLTLAEGVLAALDARQEEASFDTAAKTLRLRLLAVKGDFPGVAAKVTEFVGSLPDGAFVQALRDVYREANAAGATEGVDVVSSAVVLDDRFAAYPSSRLVSAREWLGVTLRSAETKDQYPQRFDKLLRLQFPPEQLYGLYVRNFYDVLDTPDVLRETAAIGRAIRGQLSDPTEIDAMKSCELDADFLLEDWAGALAIIDAGLADHDAAWHQMTRKKILAHQAVQDGRTEDAVRLFREFLEALPDEDQQDPTSGIVFSRDALVGLNEQRIGDLWTAAGEAAKAAEAYATARTAYRRALEANKAGKDTAAWIESRLAALPPES